MHKHNVTFNKTRTKLVTILTKCFFPYLNPTSYINSLLVNYWEINQATSILYIRSSLGTQFQIKLTILNYWTNDSPSNSTYLN